MKLSVTSINIITEEKKVDKKSQLHVFINNESIGDNLLNRFDRPQKEYRKQVIPQVMEQLKEKYPNEYKLMKDDKWTWNQKAGCGCGCSPGFVGTSKTGKWISAQVTVKK